MSGVTRAGIADDPLAGGEATPVARAQATAEGRRRIALLGARAAVGLALLGLWQFASGRLIDPFFISAPDAVFARLWQWITDGTLVFHLSYTLYATALGFAIGALGGFALGFLLGRSEALAVVLDPYITAIYCLPKIALAPLFIMWFGIGIESKIAVAAVIVFFLVFLNTFAGVRDVNPVHVNAVRIMGGGAWALLRKGILPSAAAWVFTGLKVSVPYALIGAVVGEMMSSNRGIGFLIGQSTAMFDTASTFAGLVVLAVAGATINAALKQLERHVLRWKAPA
jgi:NitT/TauT family transport system permease protein